MSTVIEDAPRATLPPKLDADAQWQVGDTALANGKRWIIRALNRNTGQVALSSANTVNADIWWNTTLDKLPQKGGA